MWNIKKYSAMAVVGAGLAFAAAPPASACGFGAVGWPAFGAAFGGCGPVGFAAPVAFGWGGGCAPVALGCGGPMGAVFPHPVYGASLGCGCGPMGMAWRRPVGYGYGYAYRRPYGSYGYAYHRPYGYGLASYRHYRPYAFAGRHYRSRSYAAYGLRSHARGYALAHGMRYSSAYGKRRFFAMRPSHRLAYRSLSRWG